MLVDIPWHIRLTDKSGEDKDKKDKSIMQQRRKISKTLIDYMSKVLKKGS